MELLMKSEDSSTSDISSDSEPDGVVEDCRPEESSSDDECFPESGSSPGDTCVVDVLSDILKHTNAEILVQHAKYTSDRYQNNVDGADEDITEAPVRPSSTRDTNVTELKAFFGLYFPAGVSKINSVITRELFDKHTGVIYFRSTMSQARFEFLTNSLCFDDRENRSELRKNDRLAAIRETFDHVVTTSQKLNVPSEYCTVYEQLLGFHGHCVFKIFIPLKPDKYGIKILMMCDSKTFYMLNAQVCTGKDSTPKGIPVAEYYFTEMNKPIHGTNINCTFDNWFTSVPLAKKIAQ
ncbi:hypothetical protein PR048_018602 [Dryococelus australis]|uniref:PiggyBac transposable element-derived protein domain-containing protein n=1 Tax=Dryococelus australis TaxID=614101 RepID=A0ABQ9HCY0_9NEOP|nr:hypothetical protein PR048_018602 [Dryococelus australis]